jgi:hypothetical protein
MESQQLCLPGIIELISDNIEEYERYIIPPISSIFEQLLLAKLERQAQSEIRKELESAMESISNNNNNNNESETSTKTIENLEYLETCSEKNQEIACLKENIAIHEQQLDIVSIE